MLVPRKHLTASFGLPNWVDRVLVWRWEAGLACLGVRPRGGPPWRRVGRSPDFSTGAKSPQLPRRPVDVREPKTKVRHHLQLPPSPTTPTHLDLSIICSKPSNLDAYSKPRQPHSHHYAAILLPSARELRQQSRHDQSRPISSRCARASVSKPILHNLRGFSMS